VQGLPPIRYIRKTTLVFLVVFLCFIAHRIFVSVNDLESKKVNLKHEDSEATYSVVCRNIVGGLPFGVDSIFQVHTRLHYYLKVPKPLWDVPVERRIKHVWFNGADTVQQVLCTLSDSTCESSIAPLLLSPGDWSVDAVEGRRLLSSRQFKVEPARE